MHPRESCNLDLEHLRNGFEKIRNDRENWLDYRGEGGDLRGGAAASLEFCNNLMYSIIRCSISCETKFGIWPIDGPPIMR